MTTTKERFVKRASVTAVSSMLAAMAMVTAAHAADATEPAAAELTQPTSTIELGGGYVSRDSFKFGEYNGLENKGPFGIGNFYLRGGGSYDSDSAFRWRLYGMDLGLESRSLGGEVGVQGKYRFRYAYDEILRNYSDTYQTFYDGAGGNALTIPAFAGVSAANRLSSTTTANGALSNWQNIQSPYATAACAATGGIPTAACAGPGYRIPSAMRDFDVETKRTRHDFDYTQELTSALQLKASVRHEEKDGTKLTGVAFGGPARGVLVPEPIHFSTDQFRVSLGWVGERSHFTIGYIGSMFKNDTNVWTVENPFNGSLLNPSFNNIGRLVGAPDNEMHQLHLSGGYTFSPATRLVVSGNYQRMTQNEAFDTGLPATWTLPETSAHAKVINTNFAATLTSRPVKELALTAQYKYEDRDNHTPSLNFYVIGGDAATTPAQLFTNRPLNFRTQQVNLDGDYSFGRRQAIKLGYEWKEVKRTVDAVPPPPAELETPFAAEKTTEHTARIEYRNSMSAMATGRISYAYSQRRSSEYEENVLLPTPTVAPFPAADPLLPGYKQFWLADRNRDRLRGVLNLQASPALAFQTGAEYTRDEYKDLEFGLKKVRSMAFNLDATYAATESLSLNAYYTYEDKKSELDSLVIGRGSSTTILDAPASRTPCTGYFAATGHLPSDAGTDPCRQWAEAQSDRVHTIGLGIRATGLLSDKLNLGADVAYSHAKSPISVDGGAYFGNGSTAVSPAFNNIYIPAQSFPDITSELIELRLNGVYALDKKSAVKVLYIYRHLKSSDWQYDAYANSALGSLAIPTFPGVGITSPNYNVSVFGISYVFSFR